jgi:hypothetical protein
MEGTRSVKYLIAKLSRADKRRHDGWDGVAKYVVIV